jgi:hypothetical protein
MNRGKQNDENVQLLGRCSGEHRLHTWYRSNGLSIGSALDIMIF